MQPKLLIVDLFCGAGGTTTGFEESGVAKVIACVNHDHVAILSHWANYPDVKHLEEDIRTLELSELVRCVEENRRMYPSAKLILWASLECTNFSRAKGGLARDADSRTLADHLHRYIIALRPEYVQIENVVEFMDWGPSQVKMKNGTAVMIKDKHGKHKEGHEPIPEHKGVDFLRWCNEICAHGYEQEWRQMNSADYGAYTSRNRLFGCFAKVGMPMVWPEPTHHKKGTNGMVKWVAVKEKIYFTDQGYSILHRGTNAEVPNRQRKDLSENTLERVYCGLIKHVAGGKEAFMIKYHGGKPRTNTVDKPLTVIDTQNRHAVVTTSFISVYHGNGDNTHSMEFPAPTIAAADINAAVFINRDFGQATSSSVDQPAGTIMSVPKLSIVSLLTLQYGGQMRDMDRPAPTLLASADKTPVYLVMNELGAPQIAIYDTDSAAVVKIKEFMALYGIADIKMRMLRVDELLGIQGFPKSYKLCGTQSDQKKFIGNSVVPDVPKAWAMAMHAAIVNSENIAA